MITTSIKDFELEYLTNASAKTKEDQIEAIKLDINTIDRALSKSREDITNAMGPLMFAIIEEDKETAQKTLIEIRFNEEVIRVLQSYKTGLTAVVDSVEFVGSQN